MARAGLYKSDVKRARDALLLQNRHPSVDAVRITLGNTGSKTTIHRYLKELETEESGKSTTTGISQTLQDLVAQLAKQLHDDAQVRIDTAQQQHEEAAQQYRQTIVELEKEGDSLRDALCRTEDGLRSEIQAHRVTQDTLQKELLTRHGAEQQVAHLQERLAENAAHSQSLEQKHEHAREALAHYRQSVKEQRDQEHRRHEQQVQQLQAEVRQLRQSMIVKQEDVTRLNQEGVRMNAELSHARQALHQAEERDRQAASRLASFDKIQQHNAALLLCVAEKDEQLQQMRRQLDQAVASQEAAVLQVRNLEITAAQLNGKLETQQMIMTELQCCLSQLRFAPELVPPPVKKI